MRARIAVVVSSMLGCLVGAPTAQAATSVNLESITGNTAVPGSGIVLQTFVTANGGERDAAVQGLITYQGAWVNASVGSNSQVSLSTVGTAAVNWQLVGLSCGTAACVAFAQIHPNPIGGGPDPVEAGLTNFPIATTYFVVDPATPIGTVVQFTWRTTPTSMGLYWYGVTNAPGVSITVVPEPTTAALLGAGLAGFALATRRRARARAR